MATKLAVLILVAGAWGFRLQPQIGAAQNQTCGKYACAPANFTFPTGGCIQVVNGTNYLQTCNPMNTTVCNTTSMMCQALPVPVVLPSWPGELCSTNQPCKYGTCQVGKCKGLGNGFPCTINDQCDPGLHCNQTGYCASQLTIGSSGCQSQFDCVNQAECNQTNPASGTCIGFATLPTGAWVTDCGGGFSRMCQSGRCQISSAFTELGICIVAPKSVVASPQICNRDSDCIGSNSVNFFMSSCDCGYNANGYSYCSPFIGDTPGVNYIAMWTKALSASAGVCNTVRRFTNQCLGLLGMQISMAQASYMYHFYANIQGNDNCIKYVYTRTYWNYSEVLKMLLALALVAFV